MARGGQISFSEACKKIKFTDENIDYSIELALEEYSRTQNSQLLELVGNLYVNAGHTVIAENIFKAMYYEQKKIHVANMIYAGVNASWALVDDTKKILFIPIPKCGSSTIKNYFTEAIYGKKYGNTVHFQHSSLYRSISHEEFSTRYKKYYKFAVVRDPIKRLVSYFSKNVSNGSLRREAFLQPSFISVPTMPGPRQFASNFHLYRQYFIDFRHHTDPIHGYLQPAKGHLDKVFQMSDLPEVHEIIETTYGMKISNEPSMVSNTDKTVAEICEKSCKIHLDWYQKDYNAYF